MLRIYYRANHIQEEVFENEIINIDNFNKILAHSPFLSDKERRVMVTLPEDRGFSLFRKLPKSLKHAVVWGDKMNYKTNEYGEFFLPKVIVFFDKKESYFPSRYYFIALVNGKLEVREYCSGSETTWFQQAELHQPVKEYSTIQRIEKSIQKLLKMAEKK